MCIVILQSEVEERSQPWEPEKGERWRGPGGLRLRGGLFPVLSAVLAKSVPQLIPLEKECEGGA